MASMETPDKSIVEIALNSGETRNATMLVQNDDRDASQAAERLPLASLQLNLGRCDGVWQSIYCSKKSGALLFAQQTSQQLLPDNIDSGR